MTNANFSASLLLDECVIQFTHRYVHTDSHTHLHSTYAYTNEIIHIHASIRSSVHLQAYQLTLTHLHVHSQSDFGMLLLLLLSVSSRTNEYTVSKFSDHVTNTIFVFARDLCVVVFDWKVRIFSVVCDAIYIPIALVSCCHVYYSA